MNLARTALVALAGIVMTSPAHAQAPQSPPTPPALQQAIGLGAGAAIPFGQLADESEIGFSIDADYRVSRTNIPVAFRSRFHYTRMRPKPSMTTASFKGVDLLAGWKMPAVRAVTIYGGLSAARFTPASFVRPPASTGYGTSLWLEFEMYKKQTMRWDIEMGVRRIGSANMAVVNARVVRFGGPFKW